MILIILTLIAGVLFFDRTLDLWAAQLFYHPENPLEPWLEQSKPLWTFFYYAAPWLTGLLLLGSISVLIASLFREVSISKKKSSIFVFLVVLLGSGLVINTILKPYWGRPRPREVLELGGVREYRSIFSPQWGGPGKSFPCGHCSVGFSYGVFWWIFRRKKPTLAALSLAGSVGAGVLMGIGRMAAGGHFLSDVVVSGLIVYWICFGVNSFFFEAKPRKASSTGGSQKKTLTLVFYGLLSMTTITTLLIASPYNNTYLLQPEEASKSIIQSLSFDVERGQVHLQLDENMPLPFLAEGSAQGFGFPGSQVLGTCLQTGSTSEMQCRVERKGFFSDLENTVHLKVNPRFLKKLTLNLKEGQILRPRGIKIPQDYQLIEAR